MKPETMRGKMIGETQVKRGSRGGNRNLRWAKKVFRFFRKLGRWCPAYFPQYHCSPMAKEKENCLEIEGTIHAVLPGTMFRVRLDNGHLVLAHISGKMRKRFIKLVTGDRVKLEMSPYDTEKARIIYRLR